MNMSVCKYLFKILISITFRINTQKGNCQTMVVLLLIFWRTYITFFLVTDNCSISFFSPSLLPSLLPFLLSFWLLLAVLGFEFRVSCLQVLYHLSNTFSTVCCGYFGNRALAFCLGQLNHNSPFLSFLHHWDDRHVPPCPNVG
jgi:hypothetical protein